MQCCFPHFRNVTLLGEVAKFVPVSPQRIVRILVGHDIELLVHGTETEQVDITFLDNNKLRTISCTIPLTGYAVLSYNNHKCSAAPSDSTHPSHPAHPPTPKGHLDPNLVG